MLERIRSLYTGNSPAAHRFRYAIVSFDLLTISFVIATSFTERTRLVEILDIVFGVMILIDFIIRVWLEADRGRFLLRLATWADIVAILSFLAPLAGEGFGFLRVLRTLRLLHAYPFLRRLRKDFPYFKQHEDVLLALANLVVFLFVMTGLIYTLQWKTNPGIKNYLDSLYFTVTTLTTTGYGDITLTGMSGRILSVGVMIIGVTLFLRLLHVIFRPSKVRFECDNCGLFLHDTDAVHCKHCGQTLCIPTEGQVS